MPQHARPPDFAGPRRLRCVMRTATARIPKDHAVQAMLPAPTRPASRASRGRALLEAHFDLIQHKLRQLSWRGGLPDWSDHSDR